jgi:hypothetical protein
MSDIYTNCTTGNDPKTFILDGVPVKVDGPSQVKLNGSTTTPGSRTEPLR